MNFSLPLPNCSLQHRLWLTALLALGLSACSSGDDTPPAAGLQGRLIDSAVSGIAYSTPSFQGSTSEAGSFEYREGERITFSIGGLQLPDVAATTVITPLNLIGSNDSSDIRVVNLARLLQTLDGNSNPDDGIDVSAAASALSSLSLDLPVDAFDENFDGLFAQQIAPLLPAPLAVTLITPEVASAHLQETLAANVDLLTSVPETDANPDTDTEPTAVNTPATQPDNSPGCDATHARVGQVANFDTLFHGVAGQLKVVDDCTVQVSMFDFDGGGPQVYFYAAQAGAYSSADAFIMGDRLDGRVFNQAEVTLKLPAGKSLDDFDGISVWCADFRVNFGDARF